MMSGCSHCQTGSGAEPAIDIAFQPIFDIRAGSVRAYEALVRGTNGESAAHVLAAVTEEDKHRFEQAVRVLAIEKAARLGLVQTGASLSINMTPSAVTEADKCLGPTIEAGRRVGLAPRRIIFEFTEKARLETQRSRAIVETYRGHGFRTALDDFGDGYAGLVTLADVPTDFVKLDIGLIRGIDSSPERQAIVRGVVAICAALSRGVVAEGVETSGELAMVAALGIRLVQGFHLGRPSLTKLQRAPYGKVMADRRLPTPPIPFPRRASARS